MRGLQRPDHEDYCLDSGILATYRDKELAPDDATQVAAHLASCAGCATEERALISSGREVYELLATLDPQEGAAVPTPEEALVGLRACIAAERSQTRGRESLSPIPLERTRCPAWYQRRRNWAGVAAAAILIALLVVPNARAVADQFLSLFRVQQFQAVSFDPRTLMANPLPDLQDFGRVQVSPNAGTSQTDLSEAQAARLVDFPIRLPSSLPSGVGHVLQFSVVHGGQATFTFSAASMHAYLVRSGHGDVVIPPNLNGATFTVSVASGVLVNYTNGCERAVPGVSGNIARATNGSPTTSPSMPATVTSCSGAPFMVIEFPSPVIQATGSASLDELRDFLLSLPGLPPQLVAQLRQIDLSTGTVPVPIPPEVSAQHVTVQGAAGLLLADNTPIGGAVLWQSHGMVYALGGAVGNATQLLNAANSLR